jgi:beta-1,4-N-acetylglucosaminyltransferase
MSRRLLVTVGTTEFNDLICALDSSEFYSFLQEKNIGEAIFQIGRGTYEPHILSKLSIEACNKSSSAPKILFFRFTPNLAALVAEADVVISHCGAGTILEALDARCSLFVAVNKSLMGDHQMELAEALAAQNLCSVIFPDSIDDALTLMRHSPCVKSPSVMHDESKQNLRANFWTFPNIVDETVGFIKEA